MEPALISLRNCARSAADRALVPYSGETRAAAILLSDGLWTCGVRIESASYSLVITAAAAALSSCVSAGRRDVVAIALSGPARPYEVALLNETFAGPATRRAPDVLTYGQLPSTIGETLPLYFACPDVLSPDRGIALARNAADCAYAPMSDFAVGCVIKTTRGRLYRGTNVEHSDWTRCICAERSALSSAISDGVRGVEALYISCLKDSLGSPCGGCRQLIVEFMPKSAIWMDRGTDPPQCLTPEELLPDAFTGTRLLR